MSDAGGLAEVAAGDDQVLGEQKIAVELGLVPVLTRVVGPPNLARAPLQSAEVPVAGADKEEIPRDRGGGENSAAGVVRPEEAGR